MPQPSPTVRYAGLALTALVALVLLADGLVGLLAPSLLTAEMAATGWPAWSARVVGVIAVVSALTYALPRTAPLGAILITGFVGGALATHVRMGEVATPPQFILIALGLAAWGGLFLRDPRVRALLPLS